MNHANLLRSFCLISISVAFFFACENMVKAKQNKDSDLSQLTDTLESNVAEMSFDTLDVKYLLGQFKPEADSNFVRMENIHSEGSARNQRIHKKTYEAFKKMYAAAKADGISLTIKSATRNFYYQKGIWERKWTGERLVAGKNLANTVANPAERAKIILKYSSMPGTSRHHWGTDIDLNDFNNSYFESGQGLREFQWLQEHAIKFGFARPYTAKGERRPEGYEEEKWHWSYLPLAQDYQKSYKALVNLEMINGFKGSEVAAELDVITNYVFGIDSLCFEDLRE